MHPFLLPDKKYRTCPRLCRSPKVANRGIQLWKELDETVFSLPKEKQRQVLRSKRDYIIQRLNADWQKPYRDSGGK